MNRLLAPASSGHRSCYHSVERSSEPTKRHPSAQPRAARKATAVTYWGRRRVLRSGARLSGGIAWPVGREPDLVEPLGLRQRAGLGNRRCLDRRFSGKDRRQEPDPQSLSHGATSIKRRP